MKESWNAMLLRWIPWSAVVVAVALLLMIGLEIFALLKPIPIDDPKEQVADLIGKQLWMRATEVMMGYVLGVLCVGVGIVFAWNGVEAATKIAASQGDARIGLTTGSGGIVVIFLGIALVAIMLLAPRARIGPSGTSGGPEANAPADAVKFIPFEL